MILATSYPFLEVFWTMLIFFVFVIWLWLLFTVLADIFRRHDASGFVKVLWIIFIILIPYFGVFIYLIAEHTGMTERALKSQEAAEQQAAQYVKSVAGQADPDRADRQSQAAARQRHDLAGRVRSDEAEGAGRHLARPLGLGAWPRSANQSGRPPRRQPAAPTPLCP